MSIRFWDGVSGADFKNQLKVYGYYTGKDFRAEFFTKDEKEQKSLSLLLVRQKSREDIINDLKNLQPFDPDQLIVNYKTYKRDNHLMLLEMMGHKNEQTTQNYYKVGLREVIEGNERNLVWRVAYLQSYPKQPC